jgi:DNA primase
VLDHRIEGVGEIDADDLLALLDADNVHDVGHDEVGFSCFYIAGHSHGDQTPSAHVNRDSLLWRCKGCGRAGNLLELVKLALPHGTTHPKALSWLREHFGEVVRKPRGGSLAADLEMRLASVRPREQASPRLPNEAETIGPEGIFHMDWRSDHEAAVYMRGRCFAPEVLEDWNIGYDTWTQRVAIPVRDETGLLVGFKGRAISDGVMAKYSLLGDTGRALRYGMGYGFDMHDARSVLFGLDRARHHGETLAVCEGELDAVACHAAGVTNAVATGTKSITSEQLWLLRAHARALVFLYDSDDAGQDAVWGFADDECKWHPGHVEKLNSFFRLYVCDDHEGDPASMSAEEVRQLATGARHWLEHALPSETPV